MEALRRDLVQASLGDMIARGEWDRSLFVHDDVARARALAHTGAGGGGGPRATPVDDDDRLARMLGYLPEGHRDRLARALVWTMLHAADDVDVSLSRAMWAARLWRDRDRAAPPGWWRPPRKRTAAAMAAPGVPMPHAECLRCWLRGVQERIAGRYDVPRESVEWVECPHGGGVRLLYLAGSMGLGEGLRTSVPLAGAAATRLVIDGQVPWGLRRVRPRRPRDTTPHYRQRLQAYSRLAAAATAVVDDGWLRPEWFPRLRVVEVRLDDLAPRLGEALGRPATVTIGPTRTQWGAVWDLVRRHPGVEVLVVRGRGFGWQGWHDAVTAVPDPHHTEGFGTLLREGDSEALRTLILDTDLDGRNRDLGRDIVSLCCRRRLENLSLPAEGLFRAMTPAHLAEEGHERVRHLVPEVGTALRLTGDVYDTDRLAPTWQSVSPLGEIFAHLARRRRPFFTSAALPLRARQGTMRALHLDAPLLLSFVTTFLDAPLNHPEWLHNLPVPPSGLPDVDDDEAGNGVPFRLEIDLSQGLGWGAVLHHLGTTEDGPRTLEMERDVHARTVALLRPGRPGHLGVLLRFHRDAPPFHATGASRHDAARIPTLRWVVRRLALLRAAGLLDDDAVAPVCVHLRLDGTMADEWAVAPPSSPPGTGHRGRLDLVAGAALLARILRGAGLLPHWPRKRRWMLLLDGGGHEAWGAGSTSRDAHDWVRALGGALEALTPPEHVNEDRWLEATTHEAVEAWIAQQQVRVLSALGDEDGHAVAVEWLTHAMADDLRDGAATHPSGPGRVG